MTSKCGKNRRVAHHTELNVSLTFSLNIDVLCDKLLNRTTATLTLFFSYDEKSKLFFIGEIIYASVLQQIMSKNQSKCLSNNL